GDGDVVHRGRLDGGLQALVALITGSHTDLACVSFLPWRFGRVRVAAPFGRRACSAWLRMARVGTQSASADIVLFDESGGVVADLFDCWFRRIELTRRGAPEDCALRLDLVPAPLSETTAPAILGRIPKIVAPLRHPTARPTTPPSH